MACYFVSEEKSAVRSVSSFFWEVISAVRSLIVISYSSFVAVMALSVDSEK